jgi:hypothetical protein
MRCSSSPVFVINVRASTEAARFYVLIRHSSRSAIFRLSLAGDPARTGLSRYFLFYESLSPLRSTLLCCANQAVQLIALVAVSECLNVRVPLRGRTWISFFCCEGKYRPTLTASITRIRHEQNWSGALSRFILKNTDVRRMQRSRSAGTTVTMCSTLLHRSLRPVPSCMRR